MEPGRIVAGAGSEAAFARIQEIFGPLLPLLHSNAHKIAVVFDFIPMHYPTVYLRHYAARAEYAAALDGLRYYDEFVCISEVAREELVAFLNDGHLQHMRVGASAAVGTPPGATGS